MSEILRRAKFINASAPAVFTAPAADPATIAWVSAAIANGGAPSTGRQQIVNTLIAGLKSDGIWSTLDRLWLLAAEDTPSALTDLVANALAVVHGAPAFSANNGYTGVGGSGSVFIDSGFNPTSGSPNFVQNSAHVSAWIVNYVTPGAVPTTLTGAYSSGTGWDVEVDVVYGVNGLLYGVVNELNTSAVGYTPPGTKTGHWLANRSGASASQIYQNAALFQSPNTASVAPASMNLYFLGFAILPPGTANAGTPSQLGMISYGGSLNSSQVTSFYNRLRSYMTAVGVP